MLRQKLFGKPNVIFACFVLLLVYFICYVSYYPGIAAYDIFSSFWQVKYNIYSNQQPLMYTFFVKFILDIVNNDYTKMIIVYFIAQILFVVGVSFYSLLWLYKNKVNEIIIIGGYFYFLIVPVLHVFAMITTKDVLFSCLFLLFAMNYIDLKNNFSKKNIFWFVVDGLLVCLLRNNMIYVMVAFLFVLVMSVFYEIFSSSKAIETYKKICLCIAIVIGIFYFTQIIFYTVCNFYMSPIGETLCVPINQISCVYVKENLSDSEKAKINFFIPDAKEYNPRFVDPVKCKFNNLGYLADKKGFWNLYFDLFKKYPKDYIKSFLNINIPYWFLNAQFPDCYSKREYIETWNNLDTQNFPEFKVLERQNFLKPLNNYYESFAGFNNKIMRMFPFSIYFSLSFPFLSLVICLYLSLRQKTYADINIYFLCLLLFATYILGPVSNFRYVYTFYLTLPFYLGILFRNEN